MVPITSTYGHTVISFGINAMKPVYDLYDQLIEAGAFSEQKFTADPLPLDKNVPLESAAGSGVPQIHVQAAGAL